MKTKQLAPLLLITLLLTSCANNQWDDSGPTGGPKQTVGLLLGAVGGGILGSTIGSGTGQIAATIGGTLLGGFLGTYIGKGLDDTDKLMAERNAQQSLETAPMGSTTSWNNSDTGRSGDFTINRDYAQADGAPCREYTTTVTIGDERHEAFGEACRHSDGSWEVVSEEYVAAEPVSVS